MDKYNVHVLRFFLCLNALPEKKISSLAADSSVREVLGNSFPRGEVNVSVWAVYHLFTNHSEILTKEMVSDEIIDAMSNMFEGESWKNMGSPSLREIAYRRRRELMS